MNTNPTFKILESDAYRKLRERCNGIDLCQFSMLTRAQLSHLENELPDGENITVLDVGCGIGKVAHHLNLRKGIKAYGIDLDDELIEEGAVAFHESVDLRIGDFDSPPWSPDTFDAIYSVDSLYFSKDLSRTVQGLNQILRVGGKAVIFWTQLIDSRSEKDILLPDQTRLASVLKELGINYSYLDFTEEEIFYWREAGIAIQDLKADFIAEGEKDFFDCFSNEIDMISKCIKEQRLARFCYTYIK